MAAASVKLVAPETLPAVVAFRVGEELVDVISAEEPLACEEVSATLRVVGSGVAEEQVVTLAAVELITVATAEEPVGVRAAAEDILAETAGALVGSDAAVDIVLARAAVEIV